MKFKSLKKTGSAVILSGVLSAVLSAQAQELPTQEGSSIDAESASLVDQLVDGDWAITLGTTDQSHIQRVVDRAQRAVESARATCTEQGAVNMECIKEEACRQIRHTTACGQYPYLES